MNSSEGLSPRQASALAFLTAATTLALQILIHRLVSAKLLNNYAFLVISLTMLGFAISGIVITVLQRHVFRRLGETMMIGACLLGLSAVVTTALFTSATTSATMEDLLSSEALARSFLRWSPYALLLAIPFTFAGTMLGALLADERLPTRRIYFFDLLGSALGALIVLPLFRYLNVESLVIGAALVLVVGASLLIRPRAPGLRLLSVTTCAVLLLAFARRGEVFSIYYPEGSMLAATRDPSSGTVLEYTEWDPLSRIEVSSIPGLVPAPGNFASLFGENATFLRRYRKLITQNNFAFTYGVDYDGRPESLAGIDETIYASAYYAGSVPKPKVAVIGVGGGFDILTALRFDASQVTGIEINTATLNIVKNVYKDYFRHWVEDPRVSLVNADGRHYLSTTPERFDVIQLSGVDSYSGTPGAAHVFSENYLYTAEAFDLYLSRLSDQGVMNMMRIEHIPPREMLRALTTAVAALRRLGVSRPKDHIVTVSELTGTFTALLVKRSPFSEGELEKLKAWTSKRPSFRISSEPRSSKPLQSAYQAFLSLEDERLERAFIRQYPFAIDPVVDDRPFFFHFSFWRHLFPGTVSPSGEPRSRPPVPALQLSLVLLTAAVSGAVFIAIFLPLAFLLRRGVPMEGLGRYGGYCAGAALGYLGIEVALMQWFGLFLGHPNFSISIVLAGLLFSSGLGSLWASRLVKRLGGIRFIAYLLAGIILIEYLFLFPRLSALMGLPFFVRVALTIALIFPIGVCLGVFLPTAIDMLKERAPHLVPWAWGVNGVFSVLAPLLAVAAATTFGISALLLATLPIYLMVAASLPGPQKGPRPEFPS